MCTHKTYTDTCAHKHTQTRVHTVVQVPDHRVAAHGVLPVQDLGGDDVLLEVSASRSVAGATYTVAEQQRQTGDKASRAREKRRARVEEHVPQQQEGGRDDRRRWSGHTD